MTKKKRKKGGSLRPLKWKKEVHRAPQYIKRQRRYRMIYKISRFFFCKKPLPPPQFSVGGEVKKKITFFPRTTTPLRKRREEKWPIRKKKFGGANREPPQIFILYILAPATPCPLFIIGIRKKKFLLKNFQNPGAPPFFFPKIPKGKKEKNPALFKVKILFFLWANSKIPPANG